MHSSKCQVRLSIIFKYMLIAIGFVVMSGCKEDDSIITIVDVGNQDRSGIARQLDVVNKYSPRVVGLVVLLTTDSLNKDISLADALSQTKNLVTCSALHNNDEIMINKWDSLERYREKFRVGAYGFSNISITDDSVIVEELPMRQYFRNEAIYAFSYMVVKMYDDRRIGLRYRNFDEDVVFDNGTMQRNFKIISVHDLMAENFDKTDLTGKIVLMGHVGDEDSFYLNIERTQRISGVEIQASFIKAIMN